MRKTILVLVVVALLGILAAYEMPAGAKKTAQTTTTSSPASSTGSATTASTSSTQSATLKDGSYTGTTVSNPYEDIQVAIVVTGGKITAITTPTLSGYDGRSSQINGYAAPQLTQEALGAQNTSIDTISGATYTSESYIQSLQSAIDQAKS